MLEQRVKKYGLPIDDGWGNTVENRRTKLLNKLRKERNSITHPSEIAEKLSDGEIKECIEIVFSL